VTPWLAYGQTLTPPGASVDNPTPNHNGLVGEVLALPYTVPPGQQLTLKAWSVEGVDPSRTAIIPWIGTAPATNAKCLFTVTAVNATPTGMVSGDWILPEGTVLNVRLVYAGSTPGYITAWYLYGILEDILELDL